MKSVNKRLATLERKVLPPVEPLLFAVIFVDAHRTEEPTQWSYNHDGISYNKGDDESVTDFQNRAFSTHNEKIVMCGYQTKSGVTGAP